jgi:hypothetical protein
MISELEKALECVLALEDIYASTNPEQQNSQNNNNTFELNLNNLSSYSADFPLTGNQAVDVLLKGGVARTNVHNNYYFHTHQQQNLQQQQQQNRKEIAKQNWKELDRLLAKIASSQNNNAKETNQDSAQNEKLEEEKETRDRKILEDVLRGRPDRWVRVASVAEKEAKRQEMQNFGGDVVVVSQQQTSEVVLGSAASSVSRMILHTLLNS